MSTAILTLLIGIIAALVVLVAMLLCRILRSQQQLQDKDEAIIRELRQNVELRDELHHRLRHESML